MSKEELSLYEEEIQLNIKQNITVLRHNKGETLEDLANGINVPKVRLNNCFQKKRFPLYILCLISNYYDVLLDDLIKNVIEFNMSIKPRGVDKE